MAVIQLETKIYAPIDRCFNLSSSIDLHKISAAATREEAFDGTTSGLIGLHQSVTWKARHFGIWFKMKVKITEYESPNYFIDEMIAGPFKRMKHRHEFIDHGGHVVMKDHFEFTSPFSILGRLVDIVILKAYMRRFLVKRNSLIKSFAESDRWKEVL